MASNFLKNVAQKQAEKIDREYGAGAYGGSEWRTRNTSAGGGTTQTATAAQNTQQNQLSGASSFLHSQAQKARERVDAEYGADAYGGSNYRFNTAASSFATVDEAAPAWERYEQITEGLAAGQERLTTSQQELETLRSAYDTNPTDANANAYNTRLRQFQADLDAYNDLVEQYTYMNSLEGIQERVDELTPLAEAAEAARNEARTVMTGLRRYGTEEQKAEWEAKLETAEADYEKYSSALNELAALYYQVENEDARERLAADAVSEEAFGNVEAIQEDMNKVTAVMSYAFNKSGDAAQAEEYKQYLMEKYGLDQKAIDQYAISGAGGAYVPRTDGGKYNNIYELYQELEQQRAQMVGQLEEAGFDYGRMEQYAQMLKDAEEYARKQAEWEAYAKEHPILSSIDTVLISPFQGVDYLKTMVGGIGSSDTGDLENYVPMNVYNMDATNYVSTVRSTVSKSIEESTDWELFGQNVASFLYQTGMSVADSATQVAAFGSAAAFFMGASAASNQAKNVIERGGTNSQAFWGGLAAGAAEVIFEKISIDQLLKPKTVAGMKDLLRETVKQAGVEASEEMLTEISNILTDVAIMGENSDFENLVAQYMLQGMSEEDAKKQAVLDCIGQVAWAGAGGALSGAAMGGTRNSVGYLRNAAAARNVRNLGQQFQQMGDDVVAAIVQEGLESDPSTDSYRMAQQIQQKMEAGETVTAQELGALYQANVVAINQEQETAAGPEGTQAQDLQNPALQARQQLLNRAAAVEQQRRQAARQEAEAGVPGTEDQAEPFNEPDQREPVGGDIQEREAGQDIENEPTQTEEAPVSPEPQENAGIIQNPVLAARQALLDRAQQRAEGAAQQQEELQGLNLPVLEDPELANPATMEPITAERTEQTYGRQAQQSTGYGDIAGIIPSEGGAVAAGDGGQQISVPAAVSLSGRDGGRRRDVPGRGRVERVPEAARQRGGTRENRDLGESRRRMAADQPMVSPSDVGVAYGSEDQTLQVLPRESWDAEIAQGVAWAESKGVRDVTVVVGPIRVEVEGAVGTVQAVMDRTERRIVIRADGVTRSFSENLEHEVGHLLSTENAVRTFAQLVKSRYKEAAWRPAYEVYQRKWAPVTNYYEGMTQEEIELYVFEEMMEDAYSETNRYGTRMSVYAAEADAALEGTVQMDQEAGTDAEGTGEETAAATERTTGPPAGQERFSYGGRYANQADSESLAEAERLEMQGVDPETIRQETGWFRGADELWRFEIDDSGMEYDREGNMRGAVDRRRSYERESRAWERLEETVSDEEWELLRQYLAETPRGRSGGTERERSLYQELEQRVGEPFTQWATERTERPSGGSEGGMLADFIRHDELFRNYPQLKNMPLRFESLESGLMGVYDGTEVVLSDTLRDAPEETLIHEVQHAIQRAEGFASGANPRYWERQLQSGYDGRTAEKRREAAELWKQYYSIRDNEPEFFQAMVDLDAMAPDVPRGEINWDTLEQVQEDPPEWQRYDAAREAAEEKYGDTKVWDFIDLRYRLKQAELTSDRSAYDLYRDTAGEIEARDAAARRTMTEEQRRRIRPNTGNEDTVFAEIEDWMGDLDQEYGPQMQEDPTAAPVDTQENIQRVASMEPVTSITGEEFRKGDTDLITQVENFFSERGNRAHNPQLGEIVLDRRGVKSDIGHGIGRKKAAAFAAVPEVIAQGQVVDYQSNWKDRGYDTAVIAAPIQIGGQPYLAGVVVIRSRLTNRFYLHEVLAENDGAAPFKTGAQDLGKPGGDTPSVVSILGKIRDVKRGTGQTGPESRAEGTRYSVDEDNQGRQLTEEQQRYFEDSQIRDGRGRLLTLYHQTDGAFTVFETQREGAGARDNGTPYGIFLKTTPNDIGLRGKRQMELYANITSPLRAANREDLARQLERMSPEYASIMEEQRRLDDTYHGRFEQAKAELRDFMAKWREENPDAGRRDLYDVPEFNRLYEAEDAVIDEWTEMANELSRRAKETITAALSENGYDGVILARDAGSFGRSTDAYIALRPEQVKNTDNPAPTSSTDIRFSVDEEQDADLKERQFRVIQESNPAEDDYHTWIRSAEEIKTFREALEDPEWTEYDSFDPDYTRGMADAALEAGEIQVFSSYPIERGVFVSPSRMEAESYSGGGSVYQRTVPLTDVAWIDPTQGQYAPTENQRFSVDEEGDAQTEQQTEEQEKKTRRQRTTRPVAESRPILAKKGLRQNLLGLFSIPDGMRAELGSVIDQYADRMLKAGSLTEQDRAALFDRMYSSGVVTLPADDYFQTGREAVKGGRVYVAPRDQHEFGDDWNDFRKRAFAAGIYMTSDPRDQGIDQWNAELADMLPGLFDADELDNRAILERIVQVAEEGKDEKVSLAEYTAQLAEEEYVSEDQVLDDMERKMDWALRTFAEKASLEIHLRDRTGVKIAQERERFAEYSQKQREREAIRRAEERDQRKAQLQRQRENRELRELQQRTLKQLQWLSKNRFRAPEVLKEAWDEVLGDIDIYAAGAANEMNWSKRYGATWRDLAQMYKEAQKSDPNFLPSKELERIVMRLDGEKIADMDISALQDLYRAAVGIRTEFYNRNNVINDEMGRMFAEVYADAKREIETAPGGYTGAAVDRLFNLEQLTPMNVLERMGGWNPDGAFYSMAKQLEKGERDMRAYTVEANRYLEDFLTEHADWVKRADGQGKDAIWYELEVPELLELGMGDKPIFGATKKVYMTPSQKVHLYLESKNTDNLRHMTGGRTFVNRELYSQGKRQEALAQGTTIKLAPETVKKIVSDLTEEEMELARLLENYYNDFAARRINAVSNALYGYDKAMSRNYAPIYTNKNYTKSEIGVFDVTAEGVGNLKARQYAVNPSYNIGAFDAFERHVEQTARFVGMSVPARNWQTLLNWREKNNSTGDVITHKWGEEGKRYITDLIERLQGGGSIERDTVSTAADRLLSRYISAIFGANPSIVTKQFGSIFMAMPELGVRNIPTPAQLRSIDKDLIAKYTSELAWRGMGYATPETKQLKENPNWTQTNKFTRFTFGGGSIIAADQAAASVLWPWAENKVRREFPDLEVGTQEQIDAGQSPFYRKVAEEFNNAVNRSQSVSDETHQGRLRKSRNPITRALTMFKSDSAQGYNQLRQRIGEAKYYERSGADAETVRKAKRAVGVTVMGILTNNLWATAITFLIALWKNKGKYYRDDEEELTVESVGIEMASTLFSSLAGLVAGGEELADVIGNIITGDTWYGIDAPGMEQVSDLIELVDQQGKNGAKLLRGAVDVLNNGGDLGEYLRNNGGDIVGGVKELAQAVATYFGGIPVNNVEAYLLGLVKWAAPEVATAYESAFSSAQKSDLTGLTGEALAVQTGSLLDLRVGDTEEGTVEALAELYEQGYKKAVPSDVPSSVSINGTDHELTPYQQQVYRDAWRGVVAGTLDELVASDLFQEADAETRQSMLERLYEYGASRAKATLFEDYETESWVEGAGEAQQAGISAAEWAAYYAMVSEIKNDKSMTSYQRGEAGRDLIRAADLTDQQKLTLYGAVYGSDADSRMEKFRAMMDAGLTFAKTMDVYGKYAELETDEEASAADQATDFHLWLEDQGFSTEQMGVIEEELKFWSMMPGQANSKVVMANDYGIEPETYDALKEAIAEIDANGSTTQDEATAAINTLPGLTTRERAILWQLQNKGWSAEKNPFDVATGQEIYNAMHAEDNEEEEQQLPQLPSLNLQETPDLPTLSLPTLD